MKKIAQIEANRDGNATYSRKTNREHRRKVGSRQRVLYIYLSNTRHYARMPTTSSIFGLRSLT